MKKTLKWQRGVAAVEFGILLIPLILIAFGTTEFGRAIYQYNTLAKATRDATRFLSRHDSTATDYPLADARCLVVYGKPCTGDSGTPLVPGLTTSMVKVCDRSNSSSCPGESFSAVDTGSGVINLVKVKIAGYQFTSLVPFVTGFTTITFGDIGTTMRQVL
ncbi:TadE/TadG family type IV pilus assembly protein [Noviherbaspirillum soli]|uniref:TadE/TadG family type IV pilus assembly protein n=1 Tax=Noviherbaspirillum soli TaxID=1064518 RepID=UPI00188D516B|nr:TadE/TadG family type IV pilus assembly protein [Noviherbaspirillum soli]